MKECEGSTSSLVFPEFAWKGFSCQESSGGQPQVGWNHWTLGVTPWARMPMPRVRLELGVFLRLIFQNTSRYMKAKVKSLASSRIFHLTKWCKATCNICSLAAWCMGANYLGWVARISYACVRRNDLAFLSFLRLNICIELAETLWAREPTQTIHHFIYHQMLYYRSKTCFTSSSPPRAIPLLQPFWSKSEQGQNSGYSLFLA